MVSDSDQLIPLSEAANLYPLSHAQLRLLARTGRLAAVKIGRDWLTTRQAVEGYLRDHEARSHDPHKHRRSC